MTSGTAVLTVSTAALPAENGKIRGKRKGGRKKKQEKKKKKKKKKC